MNLTVKPGQPLRGIVHVPGDKSISHRAALFAALAEGESRAENFLNSGVTQRMLAALTSLGVDWSLAGTSLRVQGRGWQNLAPPAAPLVCGNSATTLRLLAGALAAVGIPAVLDGSAGLRRRPMDRIIEPLRQMGVEINASPSGGAPITLAARPGGAKLRPLAYHSPVASAQVKTCLLLASLAAAGPSTLSEPSCSRDHTERMLAAMGAEVLSRQDAGGAHVTLIPPTEPLKPLDLTIPGDFSAAAFLITAALITPQAQITLPGVGLNPGRIGLLEALVEMGADIRITNRREQSGEPVGDLTVITSALHGVQVSGSRVVEMIDEFPIFAVAAAFAAGKTVVCQAEELRYKESDRINALCIELRAQGVAVEEFNDGFSIDGGGQVPGGALVDAHGDHRLALSLAVLGLAAQSTVQLTQAEIMDESFPGFPAVLQQLGAAVEVSE
jgi:3-phosphoshikimate 1-carboxyvinyltransferase